MTRKNFQLIADTIKNAAIDRQSREILAREFAASLARTNPRFDQFRFIAACGV